MDNGLVKNKWRLGCLVNICLSRGLVKILCKHFRAEMLGKWLGGFSGVRSKMYTCMHTTHTPTYLYASIYYTTAFEVSRGSCLPCVFETTWPTDHNDTNNKDGVPIVYPRGAQIGSMQCFTYLPAVVYVSHKVFRLNLYLCRYYCYYYIF